MFRFSTASLLAGISARNAKAASHATLATRMIETPVGPVRVYDAQSEMPCVVLVPDGPNVIEHYQPLIELLKSKTRVVCFDMPGFGHSVPKAGYDHSLDRGAQAVLGVLDALKIPRATLAFSCANGFYALRLAQMVPNRVVSLVLSQTPSLAAMDAWSKCNIPRILGIPVLGQIVSWLGRKRAARVWYRIALPRTTPAKPFVDTSLKALSHGGCFCLASVCQGLRREKADTLLGVETPCTLLWGVKDYSHRFTDSESLRDMVPHAEIIHLEGCGHFPDVEEPARFAKIVLANVEKYG